MQDLCVCNFQTRECDSVPCVKLTLKICFNNNLAGLCILGRIQVVVPDLSEGDAMQLNFGGALSGDEEVAVLHTLAIGLKYIWEARLSKKVVTIHQTRSEI